MYPMEMQEISVLIGWDLKNIQKLKLKLPIMMGFQSEGSAPLVQNIIVKNPETITAIRIGNPVNREKQKSKKRKEGFSISNR